MTLPRDPAKLREWQARSKPLRPGGELRRTGIRSRNQSSSSPSPHLTLASSGGQVIQLRRSRIKPVSDKRAKQNRERRAMADRLYPDRREGIVMCAVPWCTRPADDLHEPLTRARGGSITDEDNMVPLCRICHDLITFAPESELQWAYDLGLLKHSWSDGGDVA